VSNCWLTPNEQLSSYILVVKLYLTRWYPLCMLCWNLKISLKKICPRVDMSVHSDILSLIRANQSLLLLLNAACLSEKQHMIDNTTDLSQLADYNVIFSISRSLWYENKCHSKCWYNIRSIICCKRKGLFSK